MATARKLDFFTHVFRAGGCHDLPAHVQKADGGDLITTAWELDPQEKAAVMATGLVLVQQIGIVPPMTVTSTHVETEAFARYTVAAPGHDWGEPMIVPAADVLLLALHYLMQGANAIEIQRVD